MAAGSCILAKIAQQELAATIQRLGQPQQRIQAAVVGMAAVGGGGAFVDLLAAVADVVGAKQGQGFGGGTITARAADFLIVGFNRFGQVGMGDPADVGQIGRASCRERVCTTV